MKVTLKVVGRAYLTVDLPDDGHEMLGSMRARLPAEFGDILFDLGIHSLSEEDFLDQLVTSQAEGNSVPVENEDTGHIILFGGRHATHH